MFGMHFSMALTLLQAPCLKEIKHLQAILRNPNKSVILRTVGRQSNNSLKEIVECTLRRNRWTALIPSSMSSSGKIGSQLAILQKKLGAILPHSGDIEIG